MLLVSSFINAIVKSVLFELMRRFCPHCLRSPLERRTYYTRPFTKPISLANTVEHFKNQYVGNYIQRARVLHKLNGNHVSAIVQEPRWNSHRFAVESTRAGLLA